MIDLEFEVLDKDYMHDWARKMIHYTSEIAMLTWLEEPTAVEMVEDQINSLIKELMAKVAVNHVMLQDYQVVLGSLVAKLGGSVDINVTDLKNLKDTTLIRKAGVFSDGPKLTLKLEKL